LFKNEIITALRNIKRFKFYSLIKILGLALGIACCLVIFLFVQQELSFDKFHEKADRIFRLEEMKKLPIGEKPYSIIRPEILALLLAENPDVESGARVSDEDILVSFGESRFRVPAKYADPGFFDIFTFPLIEGDPKSALGDPLSAVISQDLARKLMPGQDPVGRIIRIDNKADFKVTGLMKNFPANSHIQADLVMSYSSRRTMTGSDQSLDNNYLLLREKTAAGRLETFLPGFIERHFGKRYAENNKFFLNPLTSIYFHSNPVFDLGRKSQAKYSTYLGFLGFFILFLAGINAVNLTTANAFKRLKEVGVRKVIGADRRQIVRQFLTESMLLAAIAAVAAIVLAEATLPFFNALAGRKLTIDLAGNPGFYLGLFGILLVTGLACGIYPALMLSSFRTADLVRKKTGIRLGKANLRRILVVFQFAVCILFLIGSTVAFRQLRYVTGKDLGFPKENVLLTPIFPMQDRAAAFRNELLANPEITNVSLSAPTPGEDYSWTGLVQPEGFDRDAAFKIPIFQVDTAYFQALGVPLVAGRGFLEGKADLDRAAIVNERAAKKFGASFALGKRLTFPERDGQEAVIVGVVRDFNLESLHKDIAPYIFICSSEYDWRAFIRVRKDRLPRTIDFIKSKWLKFAPNDIFEIDFLHDKIAVAYREDERTRKILIFASILAVSIACLGLFGLAAYAAESRTKEIGIRKVLGASTPGLVMLLGREFALCVLAGNVIAWPTATILMKRWLQNFAFRLPLGIWTFLLSAALAFIIAFLVVGYQSIKAALADPVDSLRYE